MTDNSEKHIKMCRKATELQEPRSYGKVALEHGDRLLIDGEIVLFQKWGQETAFHYQSDIKLLLMEGPNDEHSHPRKTDNEVVWLPGQHQLQGMISDIIYSILHDSTADSDLSWNCAKKEWGTLKISTVFYGGSPENVLLQLVMKEKFDKEWSSKDWKPYNGE